MTTNPIQKFLSKFVKDYQRDFDRVKDSISPRVREAMETLIEVSRILADESKPDDIIGDTLFPKVPKEKIEEALLIIDEWEAEIGQEDDEDDEEDDYDDEEWED